MVLPTVFLVSFLGLANMVLGITLLLVSNVKYYRRTGENSFKWLWIARSMMTRQELFMNRLGVMLTLLGLAVSWGIVGWSRYVGIP